MEKTRELKSPIFALYIINNYLIIASGGGGKKFGVKNKLLSFQISSSGISNQVFENEMDDIPVFISGIPSKSLFCVCMNNATHFYTITPKGEFTEIYKQEILPFKSEEIFQSVCQISEDGNHFAAGCSNGRIKIYNLKLGNKPKEVESMTLVKESTPHLRSIDNIILLPNKKILLTASGDGSCKMFEMVTLKELKKITFRQSINEPANYFMRDIIYDPYYNVLYTLQSPSRGKTFITKWNLNKNLDPICSLEVNDQYCPSFCYSATLGVIAVTHCDGHLIYVDPINMSIIKKDTVGENMIKCGKFYEGYFISGSVDNMLRITKARTRGMGFMMKLIQIAMISLVLYYIYLKKYNMIPA